jgi:hypothetical protein
LARVPLSVPVAHKSLSVEELEAYEFGTFVR